MVERVGADLFWSWVTENGYFRQAGRNGRGEGFLGVGAFVLLALVTVND